MFTGIIENTGSIRKWAAKKTGGRIELATKQLFKDMKLGESIAINGCCLTLVQAKSKSLAFDVSDETMRKTAFAALKSGETVNLERAMPANGRFGGHYVTGHVDAVGKIDSVREADGSVVYQISYPKAFAKLLIEKGSVAVDGISLTVCNLTKTSFRVYIIPHTLKETNLGGRQKGDAVNLEFDVLGKYLQNMK
jgi:riboflavin synthase